MDEKIILIADDDPIVHESLGLYLKNEGYSYDSVYDGQSVLDKFNARDYKLIILDLMMPEISGIDVCREIRKSSNVPIIMLTAKGDEIDRIIGLELGADDYIVKPFSPREVIARVKVITRRIDSTDSVVQHLLEFPDLRIDLDTYEVEVEGMKIPFTPKEVEVLYFLASHPGKVMTRGTILNSVWGEDYYGDSRTIDTHIKQIRQKIGYSSHWSLVTVYGIGYKFEAERNRNK